MIQIYYGNGKGKTSCAVGSGMRASGAGMKVAFVQFFKDNKSSELSVLPFDIYNAPDSLPFNPDISYLKWVNGALEYIQKSDADVIILDEFLDLVPEFISVSDALEILNLNSEIIITGHKRIEEIFDRADYITYMKKERHPFDSGIKARKGIEF